MKEGECVGRLWLVNGCAKMSLGKIYYGGKDDLFGDDVYLIYPKSDEDLMEKIEQALKDFDDEEE